MSGDAGRTLGPEFPNLAPEVVEGYRNAPVHLVAEIVGGELSLLPRPRPRSRLRPPHNPQRRLPTRPKHAPSLRQQRLPLRSPLRP